MITILVKSQRIARCKGLNCGDRQKDARHTSGRRLTGLAALLKPFGIRPRDIRFDQETFKGYLRCDFEEVWERNLTPSPFAQGFEGQQRQQSNVYAVPSDSGEKQRHAPAADRKNTKSLINSEIVAEVASLSATWQELGLSATPSARTRTTDDTALCGIHPLNTTNWWQRGNDPMCGDCHPNPAALSRCYSRGHDRNDR